MGKQERLRIGREHVRAWVGIVAVVLAIVGAVGPDELPAEIPDETFAAVCLACVAAGSDWLKQVVQTHRLTSREIQVCNHVGFGWRNQDIAAHLDLSVRTIETHLRHVYAKLGIHTRVQLALLVRGHPDR